MTHTCADEAFERVAQADARMAELMEVSEPDEQIDGKPQYSYIAHLRQTAIALAALGHRPYYADQGPKR